MGAWGGWRCGAEYVGGGVALLWLVGDCVAEVAVAVAGGVAVAVADAGPVRRGGMATRPHINLRT